MTLFNIDLSSINIFIGQFFGEVGKLLDIINFCFERLVFYIVLFFANSFECFMIFEIGILAYAILKSKQIGAEFPGQGGFNKVIFMFEWYLTIHYKGAVYLYLFFESLYKIAFRTATLIIDGIRLFKPFG
jgi:hypothetical protein